MTDGLGNGGVVREPTFEMLLQVMEAMPEVEAVWELDCLRTALRVARATAAPADIERARIAYNALGPDAHARLLDHLTAVARRQSGNAMPTPQTAERQPSRLVAVLSSLIGRPVAPSSGATAKERLLRDPCGLCS